MDKVALQRLRPGDVIRPRSVQESGKCFIVQMNEDDHVTVAFFVRLTNEVLATREWYKRIPFGIEFLGDVRQLQLGDLVWNARTEDVYLVTGVNRSYATAVDAREVNERNADGWVPEWEYQLIEQNEIEIKRAVH